MLFQRLRLCIDAIIAQFTTSHEFMFMRRISGRNLTSHCFERVP